MMSAMLGLHTFSTPAAILADVNIEHYDSVLAEVQARHAADLQRAANIRHKAREFEQLVASLERRLPSLLLDDRDRMVAGLHTFTQLAGDGIAFDHSTLAAYLKESERKVKEAVEVSRRAKQKIQATRKLDPDAGRVFLRSLDRFEDLLKPVAAHYRFFGGQVKDLAKKYAAVSGDGRIERAAALYREALTRISGVRGVGAVVPMLLEDMPIYRLPIIVTEDYISDRSRVRDNEREVHDFVEDRDPSLVGTLVLEYEPAAGAA